MNFEAKKIEESFSRLLCIMIKQTFFQTKFFILFSLVYFSFILLLSIIHQYSFFLRDAVVVLSVMLIKYIVGYLFAHHPLFENNLSKERIKFWIEKEKEFLFSQKTIMSALFFIFLFAALNGFKNYLDPTIRPFSYSLGFFIILIFIHPMYINLITIYHENIQDNFTYRLNSFIVLITNEDFSNCLKLEKEAISLNARLFFYYLLLALVISICYLIVSLKYNFNEMVNWSFVVLGTYFVYFFTYLVCYLSINGKIKQKQEQEEKLKAPVLSM